MFAGALKGTVVLGLGLGLGLCSVRVTYFAMFAGALKGTVVLGLGLGLGLHALQCLLVHSWEPLCWE